MLSLARGESTFGEVAVQHLIDEVLHGAGARSAEGRHRPARAGSAGPCACNGDPVQLEQVLLNLLINARQAMLGKGGSLTVKPRWSREPEMRIQVIDTGPGIPEKLLPKIFQPFFTTKGTARKANRKARAGPGDLQRNQSSTTRGGSKCRAKSGKGTTFSIYLPAA